MPVGIMKLPTGPQSTLARFRDDPYDGEIAFADAQVARLIDWLERRDLLTKTIVVIIGDHLSALWNQHRFDAT